MSLPAQKALLTILDQLTLVTEAVQTAQQVVVVVAAPPEVARAVDRWAAATVMATALTDLGKQVQFVAPAAPHLDKLPFPLPGLETVQTELGKKNLQIIFPYQPTQVDKVSYHVDEERQQFSLIIQPQKGQLPLATDQVTYEYMGAEADLIILIGAKQYDDLGQLYWGHEVFYENTRRIALALHETKLGDINIDGSTTVGLCEMMARLLQHWQRLTPDAATALLAGIEEQTQGLQSLSVTADTLELASQLLRAGARRVRRSPVQSLPRALSMGDGQNFAAALGKKPVQLEKLEKKELPKKKTKNSLGGASPFGEANASRK